MKHLFWCLVLISIYNDVSSNYLITVPRRWTRGSTSQICVILTKGQFSDTDSLQYNLEEVKREGILRSNEKLNLPIGESKTCLDLEVPQSDDGKVTLDLNGTLGDEPVLQSFNLTFVNGNRRTFIQTDKFLYRQGQTVQFRILTINGPGLNVDTKNYSEVYISDPSRTRIAQWRDVDNSQGLVHLSFDLHDEADEGSYSVVVSSPDGSTESKVFRVEDYVLPKYEITLNSPNAILGSDESVTIELCAKYTFGEPVAGRANISLSSGSWKSYVNLTQERKIKGCDNFTFSAKDLLFDYNNCHIKITNLKARATVTEKGTDVELRGSNDHIKVHRQAISFSDETPTQIKKPYLPYRIKVTARYQDGSPASSEAMKICTDYMNENVCKEFTTDAKGGVSVVIPSDANSRVEITAVNYPTIERFWNDVMRQSSFRRYRSSYKDYTNDRNSSLTIYTPNILRCTTGQNISVDIPVIYIINEQTSADLYLQISSRGQVVSSEKIQVEFKGSKLPFEDSEQLLPLENLPSGFVRGVVNVPVTLPTTVSPAIDIVAWFSTSDGVVLADTKRMETDGCLPHAVEFSWSTEKEEPGKEATLNLKAAENALCSVGVVDKSVELLSSHENSLTIGSLLRLVHSSQGNAWDEDQLDLDYCHSKYNYSVIAQEVEGKLDLKFSGRFRPFRSFYEALHVFSEAGYYVASDLDLEKQFCDYLFVQELKSEVSDINHPPPVPMAFLSPMNTRTKTTAGNFQSRPAESAYSSEPLFMDRETISDEESVEVSVETRDYLPETWLWLLKPLSSTGELKEKFTLPESITEWVGKAVCIHPTEGVGLSGTSSITTFTPFFTDLTLPASASRGEVLPVKISIFNYLEEDLPVKMTVEPSEEYSFTEGETGVREVCIPPKSKSVETVKIVLAKIGQTNVTVDASSHSSKSCGTGSPPTKRDRFVRSLPVEAEGYVREKTWTKYLCADDLENQEGLADTWDMATPASFVEDSARAWVTVIGDLMGPTIENLGNLIRFPSGCGEQNMVNFAPNIYIMQYLENSGQNNDVIREKLTKFLSQGYQRQVKFKHGNHSYSTFGTKDPLGSTWLTAFVVKSFAQAKPFTFIDEDSLSKSSQWLKDLQNEQGCFESRGRVLLKQIQGGLSSSGKSEALLTAYVLAALLEEGNVTSEVVDNAIECIKTDNSDHPYSLALKAYSLSLANAPSAKATIDILLEKAVSNSSALRWNLPDRKGSETSLHIETAAYALLALVTHDPVTYSQEARKIVRWLSSKRNGQGGFVSTQDTVVALQALTAFEKARPSKPLNMNIQASSADLSHSFTINNDNKFLQQLVDVPVLPSVVNLTASGDGCVLMQGVLRYNVLSDTDGDAFSLNVTTHSTVGKDCNTHEIVACAKYNLADGASNMAIIEVKLVSGFIPVKEDLKNVVGRGDKLFKRYEVDGPKVFFYLEEITSEEVCARFKAIREVAIENAKPGSVTVYDYYQPEYTSTQKFTLDSKC